MPPISLNIRTNHHLFLSNQFPAGEIPFLAIPALASGNTVIVKPSEVTPLTGALYCSAFASVLPEGVLQVVQGDGAVGEQLVSSEDVHMVAMTGSSATGKRIMETCAKNLKRLVLELGGKDPMIVFADADLDKAANDAVSNSLFNAGQVCCAVERIYIEKSVQTQFEQKVVELAKKQMVGIPTDDGVTLGPMVSQMQLENVKKQVDESVEKGANVLYKSEVPQVGGGNFYPVTVLSGLDQDMLIQREETFGPGKIYTIDLSTNIVVKSLIPTSLCILLVVAMSVFDGSEEEAAKLANDTEYGLASYVYSGDLEKASRVARKIRSGQGEQYEAFYHNMYSVYLYHSLQKYSLLFSVYSWDQLLLCGRSPAKVSLVSTTFIFCLCSCLPNKKLTLPRLNLCLFLQGLVIKCLDLGLIAAWMGSVPSLVRSFLNECC